MKTIFISQFYEGFLTSASHRFRCEWIAPHLNADIYNGTQDLNQYDTIIYQNTHSPQSRILAERYKDKIQIFDVSNPIHLWRPENFHYMAQRCKAITCSSEDLYQNFLQMPYTVYYIPDRQNLDFYTLVKEHQDHYPILVWYGFHENYDNNIGWMLDYIRQQEFQLFTITDNPLIYGQFIKWELETSNENIIRGDIVLNPPVRYKSKNKTTTAWALNMPVAETINDIKRFTSYKNRVEESDRRQKEVREQWEISQSARELRGIINKYAISKN